MQIKGLLLLPAHSSPEERSSRNAILLILLKMGLRDAFQNAKRSFTDSLSGGNDENLQLQSGKHFHCE
jgi:hypothetical protein